MVHLILGLTRPFNEKVCPSLVYRIYKSNKEKQKMRKELTLCKPIALWFQVVFSDLLAVFASVVAVIMFAFKPALTQDRQNLIINVSTRTNVVSIFSKLKTKFPSGSTEFDRNILILTNGVNQMRLDLYAITATKFSRQIFSTWNKQSKCISDITRNSSKPGRSQKKMDR